MYDLRPRRVWETEESGMFRDMLRRFLSEQAVPLDSKWREQKFVDREFWRKAGKIGILCPSVGEEYGGGGGDFALEAVVGEELAYAGITSFQQIIHGGIVAHYFANYGTEAQKQRWLPKMCTGEYIGAIAMTEPGGGSDLQGVTTTATLDGDHYVLNGAKTFITNGYHADLIIVVAKTDPSLGAKGISLIVVETVDLPGFKRGASLKKIGMHGSDTVELFFDDMRVPVANRLGDSEGQGFVQLMQQLPQERLCLAVGAQARMERAVEITVEYVNERKAFGNTLMGLQNTRFKLADALSAARVSRAFTDQCIAEHIIGELSAADASMAKMWTTDTQSRIVDECLQLHGGYGFMDEYLIGRLFVDTRVERIYGGANEIMKEIIAQRLVS